MNKKTPAPPAHSANHIDINKALAVHIVTDLDEGAWVHTHGMDKLGLAELEIRKVPLPLIQFAGQLLNEVADLMVNWKERGDKPVKVGESIQFGRLTLFRVVAAAATRPDEADHYEVMRWAVVAHERSRAQCDACATKAEGHLH